MVYLLGIDAGTTALKAVLFNESGNVISTSTVEYEIEHPTPAIAELNAEKYWTSCTDAIKYVLNRTKIDTHEVLALAVSSQAETVIFIDKEGEPIRKAIVWLDNRAIKESKIIEEKIGLSELFKVTGEIINPILTAPKILWLKRNHPQSLKELYKCMFVEDYLIYKLSGKFITDYSVVCSSLMFDLRKKRWWDEMLDLIGINEDQLSELRPSGKIVGTVTEKAANQTGLNVKTVVSTGAHDHCASAVGAGNIMPGIVSETTGASLALVATTNKIVYDDKYRVPCHCHAIENLYFLHPGCHTAGMILRWFRDEFAYPEAELRPNKGENLYQILEKQANNIPPGSNGLIMLPFFEGLTYPSDPLARGVFFGLTLSHTKGHFVKAIMESVAYMLKQNIDLLEELGIQVKEIISLGGGAKSSLWNQIKADVTQKSVLTSQIKETTALGAAILAGKSVNLFETIEEGCKKMISLKEKFNPQINCHEIYKECYDIYLKLYLNLIDLFPRLSSIREYRC